MHMLHIYRLSYYNILIRLNCCVYTIIYNSFLLYTTHILHIMYMYSAPADNDHYYTDTHTINANYNLQSE